MLTVDNKTIQYLVRVKKQAFDFDGLFAALLPYSSVR